MFKTTLQGITLRVAQVLAHRNRFKAADALNLGNGVPVTVTRRSRYVTPAGIIARYTVRLDSGIEFDAVDARYIANIENWK